MANNKSAGLPDGLVNLLAQADKQRGFPQGTLAAVMQQETGGNAKYLEDPSTYHYGLNAQGQRVAGHTGKVSTAFGPFGILESTGRDPGFGVKPLANKSIEEQVRFAGDYLAARALKGGGLQAGLAGYGEGGKYGQQVMARLGQPAVPVQQPIQAPGQSPVHAVPAAAVQQVAVAPEAVQEVVSPQAVTEDWQALQRLTPDPVQVADLNFGHAAQPQVPEGFFDVPKAKKAMAVNFSPFAAWKARV